MTAWLITTDRSEDHDLTGTFNCSVAYSPTEQRPLEARLRAGEGRPFLMGDDDWDYTKTEHGENGEHLYYRGRVIFDDDKDYESGRHSDNMLIDWGRWYAGCTRLIVSPGNTSIPRSMWEYRGD